MSGGGKVVSLVPKGAGRAEEADPTASVLAWLRVVIARIESGEIPAPHTGVVVLAGDHGPVIGTRDGFGDEGLDVVRAVGLLHTASHCVLAAKVDPE